MARPGIGKFLPLHHGHVALIHFAASHCKELIVSMSYTETDPIDASIRFDWIKETFRDMPAIKPVMVRDDFDDPSLPFMDRMQLWATGIGERYPGIDVIISSEEYGAAVASLLGIAHISFDPERTQVPVSASRIRSNPYQHWQYIPAAVRPYYVKRVCLYGPESTGKSTLAQWLAVCFDTEFVPEVAREMISSNEFTLEDIERIGHAQTMRVLSKTKTANKILFCDTDVITTQIYSRHYLHAVPDVLYTLEKQVHYHHYFLFDVDVPWVADGLRDLGNRRKDMFDAFRNELVSRNISFTLVTGDYAEREKVVIQVCRQLLS
ncbi:MAG: AAA family ATPase [Bacteroidia bacterium]|nr:AAA family ATPase [Bacteroidia bacterium]